MSKARITARVLSAVQLECNIVSPSGKELKLTGTTGDVDPAFEGSAELHQYKAIVDNAWAFAEFTFQSVNLETAEEQQAAAKRAAAHREMAEWIVALADDPASVARSGWCSGCFAHTTHSQVKKAVGRLPTYLCEGCGTPTSPCAAGGCDHMAVRKRGPVRVPRYCAEHRHDIQGFEKAHSKIDSLGDYEQFLEHEQPNLSRAGKLAGVAATGLAIGATAGIAAAPAIGGAVGTLVGGYSGAAATSYGLALLGGGSIAAGGYGMAGGVIVVSVVSGALGGSMGASVTNAYVREDRSFRIEQLKAGDGVPVVVCNGFLSESGTGWGQWKGVVAARYPDSPVFRVHWGSKELKSLGLLAGFGALQAAGQGQIVNAALAANKAAAQRLGPLGPVLAATNLAKNPWYVARSRASKTGVVVADLIARTEQERYVLIGHSLGARAMLIAAQTLGTKSDGPRLEAVHLLGAAISVEIEPDTVTARVDDAVYNYHSTNDNVLKYLYKSAQAGQSAAGRKGFERTNDRLKNVDVSAAVKGHSDYHANVTLL
jgi:pimeloyl-ACP methyl ester carboxylesterase